eukprot:1188693-Prorocentrum_minimum.AAC.7
MAKREEFSAPSLSRPPPSQMPLFAKQGTIHWRFSAHETKIVAIRLSIINYGIIYSKVFTWGSEGSGEDSNACMDNMAVFRVSAGLH